MFDTTEFDFQTIRRHLHELAFLNSNATFTLTDERTKQDGKFLKCEYHYSGGLVDFAKYAADGKTALSDNPIYVEGERDGIFAGAAILYTDAYGENVVSYVNNIPTSQGGTHEAGFRSALTRVFNEFARRNNLMKDKETALIGEDFRDGLMAVLSVRMKNVQFEGQNQDAPGEQ